MMKAMMRCFGRDSGRSPQRTRLAAAVPVYRSLTRSGKRTKAAGMQMKEAQEQEPWSFLDGMSAEPSFTAPTMLVPAAKSAVALPTSTSEFMSYNASAAMPSSSASSSSSASADSEPFGLAKDVDLDLSVHREEDKSESAMSLSVMDSGSESSSNDAYVAAAATTDPSARAATDAAGAAGPISSMQPVCEEVEPEADMYPRDAAHREGKSQNDTLLAAADGGSDSSTEAAAAIDPSAAAAAAAADVAALGCSAVAAREESESQADMHAAAHREQGQSQSSTPLAATDGSSDPSNEVAPNTYTGDATDTSATAMPAQSCSRELPRQEREPTADTRAAAHRSSGPATCSLPLPQRFQSRHRELVQAQGATAQAVRCVLLQEQATLDKERQAWPAAAERFKSEAAAAKERMEGAARQMYKYRRWQAEAEELSQQAADEARRNGLTEAAARLVAARDEAEAEGAADGSSSSRSSGGCSSSDTSAHSRSSPLWSSSGSQCDGFAAYLALLRTLAEGGQGERCTYASLALCVYHRSQQQAARVALWEMLTEKAEEQARQERELQVQAEQAQESCLHTVREMVCMAEAVAQCADAALRGADNADAVCVVALAGRKDGQGLGKAAA